MTSTRKPPAAPSGFWTQNCHSRARGDGLDGAWSAGRVMVAMGLRSSTVVADARVEPSVDDVDRQVGEGEDGDHEHHQGLRHVVVLVGYRLHEQLAEAVEVEHLLGHDQPAHQESELDADDGD